jgi:hypothetical protein
MAECPDCGAENPDGAAFCGLCAHRLDGRPDPVENGTSPAALSEASTTLGAVDQLNLSKIRKKKGHRVLWIVSAVAILAIAVLAVFFIQSRMEKHAEGIAEFTSPTSGLSFKYPSSWELKDRAYLKTLAHGQELDPYQGNETVLMKRGSAVYKHLLTVSSRPVDFSGQSWEQTKSQLETGFVQSGEDQRSNIVFINPGLSAATGAHAIGMMYKITPSMGPDLFQLETYILRGNIAYSFTLTTPLKGGGADETQARNEYTELMRSITFKI